MVDFDSSRDGCVRGKNTFLFLAEVPSPKAEGGVELRGAHRHLGRPRANNLSWKQDGYLHYRLSRPTPWRHQQHGLTAEVPKPGGRCHTTLWKLVLAPRSLLSQVLLITHVHRVTLSHDAPHPHKYMLVVIVHCVASCYCVDCKVCLWDGLLKPHNCLCRNITCEAKTLWQRVKTMFSSFFFILKCTGKSLCTNPSWGDRGGSTYSRWQSFVLVR